jgi:hypothetical protein
MPRLDESLLEIEGGPVVTAALAGVRHPGDHPRASP